MLLQALQLTPYIAIAAGILLSITIGVICYSQFSRRAGFAASWHQPILSMFQEFWSIMIGERSSRPGVVIHDPSSSKPHDLDDPFFDKKVQERVGAVIASAARKK
jgi:hypothetical protein